MTAQEQQMIQSLADRINNTPLAEKDPDAERFLQQALGRNPDALYILAQTTLVQQYALEQAQKQLADARSQIDQLSQQAQAQPPQPKHASSFLGNLLGLNDEPARPAAPPPPQNNQPPYAPVQGYNQQGYNQQNYGGSTSSFGYVPQQYGQPSYAPPQYGQPQYGQPQYGQPQYGQPQYGQPQPGGFLRSAMQTATGVAAGALAFEGIESLMHGFGGGGGSNFGSGMGGGRPEEIVNNYYGDSAPGEHKEHLSPDIEDRRHDSTAFEDAVDHDDHHDTKAGFLDSSDQSNSDTTDDASFADDSSMNTDDYSSDDTNN